MKTKFSTLLFVLFFVTCCFADLFSIDKNKEIIVKDDFLNTDFFQDSSKLKLKLLIPYLNKFDECKSYNKKAFKWMLAGSPFFIYGGIISFWTLGTVIASNNINTNLFLSGIGSAIIGISCFKIGNSYLVKSIEAYNKKILKDVSLFINVLDYKPSLVLAYNF